MKKSVFLAGAAALMILASCGGKKAEAPAAAEQPRETRQLLRAECERPVVYHYEVVAVSVHLRAAEHSGASLLPLS